MRRAPADAPIDATARPGPQLETLAEWPRKLEVVLRKRAEPFCARKLRLCREPSGSCCLMAWEAEKNGPLRWPVGAGVILETAGLDGGTWRDADPDAVATAAIALPCAAPARKHGHTPSEGRPDRLELRGPRQLLDFMTHVRSARTAAECAAHGGAGAPSGGAPGGAPTQSGALKRSPYFPPAPGLISRMKKHCVLLLPFFGYPMVMLRLHTQLTGAFLTRFVNVSRLMMMRREE